MKRLQALLCLVLVAITFVNAQVTPNVYWRLDEVISSYEWKKNKLYQYNYNNAGSITEFYTKHWDSGISNWFADGGKYYTYTVCNGLIEEDTYSATDFTNKIVYFFDDVDCAKTDSAVFLNHYLNPNWTINRYQTYVYDSLNRLEKIIGRSQSDGQGTLGISTTKTFQYNAQNNITAIYNFALFPGMSYSNYATRYYYSNNTVPNATMSYHNGTDVTNLYGDIFYNSYFYKDDSAYTYYNNQNNIDSVINYKNNNDSLYQWYLYNKHYYTYNVQNKLDSIKTFGYHVNTSQWQKDSIQVYEYDANNIYRITTLKWDGVNWNNYHRITYGYIPTAIAENPTSNNQFNLYPNPTNTDNTIISFTDTPLKPYTIELYSTDGKLLRTDKAIDKVYTLNTAGLTNGIYLVKITIAEHTTTQRLCILK